MSDAPEPVDVNSVLRLLEQMFEADNDVILRIHGVPEKWLEAYTELQRITPDIRASLAVRDYVLTIPTKDGTIEMPISWCAEDTFDA